MRQFLEALAREEMMEIGVRQYQIKITPKIYDVKPREFEKVYSNQRLLQKRLYIQKYLYLKHGPLGQQAITPKLYCKSRHISYFKLTILFF